MLVTCGGSYDQTTAHHLAKQVGFDRGASSATVAMSWHVVLHCDSPTSSKAGGCWARCPPPSGPVCFCGLVQGLDVASGCACQSLSEPCSTKLSPQVPESSRDLSPEVPECCCAEGLCGCMGSRSSLSSHSGSSQIELCTWTKAVRQEADRRWAASRSMSNVRCKHWSLVGRTLGPENTDGRTAV